MFVYFNTLNFLGLNIQKDKNIYILKNALCSLNLSDEEKCLFYEIIENVHLLHNERMENVIKDVVYRIVKYVNDGEIDTAYLDKLIERSKEKSALSVNNTVSELSSFTFVNLNFKYLSSILLSSVFPSGTSPFISLISYQISFS